MLVARRNPTGLPPFPMEGLQRRAVGQVNADLHRLPISGGKGERIAQAVLPGRNHDPGLAVEAQRLRRVPRMGGDAGSADPQRLGAVGIAQADPQARPAQTDASALAKGLVLQLAGNEGRKQEIAAPHRLRAGLPAGHPVRGR